MKKLVFGLQIFSIGLLTGIILIVYLIKNRGLTVFPGSKERVIELRLKNGEQIDICEKGGAKI